MTPVCPYCAVNVTEDFHYCSSCGTAHHEECWVDNGGCTVFGCSSAPQDEPKLNVMVPSTPARTVVPYAPAPQQQQAARATPPPPPPPGFHPTPASHSAYSQPPYSQQNYSQVAASSYNVAPTPPPLPPHGGYYAAPQYGVPPAYYPAPPKSRTAFIVLGIFLGAFGGHNFFAGYKGRAIAQLCITVCSVFTLSLISAIWAIVEICTVDRDSKGIPMI